MKRRWKSDAAFRAKAGGVFNRLHADPAFAARRDARMACLNADPQFCARQRAAVSIEPKTRAAILAALKADPSAVRVARKIGGASYATVLRIARAAGIALPNNRKLTLQQKFEAIRRRNHGEPPTVIARSYGVNPSTISRLGRPR